MPLPPYIIANKSVHSQSVLANRLYRVPEIQRSYHATMRDLLANHWDEERLIADVDPVQELLKNDIHKSNRRFARAVRDVRYFIETRREVLTKEIENWPIELKDGPRRPPYFKQIGTANVSFETQWYDKTPASPDSVGHVEMELILDGQRVTFRKIGAYSEPNQRSGADEKDGRRPPTVVFHGRRESSGKPITLGIGLSSASFHPTGDSSVDVEGILIEGNRVMFFAKMVMGAGELVWIKGHARFVAAEMKRGAPVQGEMELRIMKMFGGKPE